MAGQERYLRYEQRSAVVSGVDHQVANLACLLREAHASGRRAILPPLLLHAQYNFDVCREWRWESLFDFHRSRLVDAAGRRHPLPIAPGPPPAGGAAGLRVLRLAPGVAPPPDAGAYRLVVRRIEQRVFARDVPAAARPAVRLQLRAAARVLALARPVVEHLRSLDGGRFTAVHVRRGERMREFPRLARRDFRQYPGRLTEPARIRTFLRARGVRDGSVVFLFSDEPGAAFWQPLHRHYRVFHDLDFPVLAALSSPSGEPLPDNHLLYLASLEVMRGASLRVGTLPAGRPHAPPMHAFLVSERQWRRLPLLTHAAVQTLTWSRLLLRWPQSRRRPRGRRRAARRGPPPPATPGGEPRQ